MHVYSYLFYHTYIHSFTHTNNHINSTAYRSANCNCVAAAAHTSLIFYDTTRSAVATTKHTTYACAAAASELLRRVTLFACGAAISVMPIRQENCNFTVNLCCHLCCLSPLCRFRACLWNFVFLFALCGRNLWYARFKSHI